MIAVLDALSHRVVVFDSTGALVAEHAARGQGPGEFLYPRGLDLSGPLVHVFDPGSSRVSTFEVEPGSIRLISDFRLPLDTGWDMCLAGEQFFVLRWSEHHGGLIHAFSRHGRLLRSFGEPVRSTPRLLAGRTDVGLLLCSPQLNRIFFQPRATPIVRAYSLQGDLQWETAVPGMLGPEIEVSGTTTRWRAPEGRETSDAAVTLTALSGDVLLVQYGRTRRGGGISNVVSVMISAVDGTVLSVHRDLPQLDEVAGSLALSAQVDPFPRIEVYRREGRSP